jgi:peptidoglycan/LPS O-acetylase OafA/YrhL
LSQEAARYSWGTLFSNLALTADVTNSPVLLGTLWTLSVELEMYVAMPIIFMSLGPTRSPRVALCLWLLAASVAWMQPAIAERLTAIDFAPCFIAGTVAYTLSGWYARRIPALLWSPFLLAILCGFVITQQAAPEGASNMPLEWVFCLTLGLFIPLFHDSTLSIVNYAANRIARYSYGIYLSHYIALWVGFTVLGNLPEPCQWAIALALVAVMSVGAYHLLEKPAIDFGARLTGSKARADTSAGQVTYNVCYPVFQHSTQPTPEAGAGTPSA